MLINLFHRNKGNGKAALCSHRAKIADLCCFAFLLCTTVGISNTSAFLGGVLDSPLYFFLDLAVLTLAVYFGAQSAKLILSIPAESEVEV